MRKVSFSRDAARFGETRLPKHQRQIAAKIDALRQDPTPPDSKTLMGSSEQQRRADVGEFRIIYRFDDDFLYVELIGKRNDDEVYRRFKRR